MVLPITVQYADVQARLPRHHGDPFDRLLVAHALVEDIAIVSADDIMDLYGIRRIW
jgi:PIN domain nuclease of toxin-antitoxin system